MKIDNSLYLIIQIYIYVVTIHLASCNYIISRQIGNVRITGKLWQPTYRMVYQLIAITS